MKITAKEGFLAGYQAGYDAFMAAVEEVRETGEFSKQTIALTLPVEAEGDAAAMRLLGHAHQQGVQIGASQAKLDSGFEGFAGFVDNPSAPPVVNGD